MSYRVSRLLRNVKATPRKPIATLEYRLEDGRHLEYRKTARGWVRTGGSIALGLGAVFD